MSMQNIVALLRQTIGLDESVAGASIQQSVRQRMKKNGVADEHAFLKILRDSPEEMTALVEDVTVPETWFFRYREAFQLMKEHLGSISGHDRPLRLLSMPCSTGEEPYSMAMTLLDTGLSPQTFQIDAVDISRRHLGLAERAIYRPSSFRGTQLDFRQRYFHQTDEGFVLSSRVRDCVQFHQANILDHERLEKMGVYDVICCRNLLIYLDDEHRKRTVSLLASMLRDDGVLFVGHAETGLIWQEMFQSIAAPMAFAYRRNHQKKRSEPSAAGCLPGNINRPHMVHKDLQSVKNKRQHVALPEIPGGGPGMNAEPCLESASRLADQGKLEEARQQCEICLQQQGASAGVWFLLGLISDIEGKHGDAEAAFRKTLYLEPEHQEALMHLAFLMDKRGNSRAAQHLRDRARRCHDRQQAGQ